MDRVYQSTRCGCCGFVGDCYETLKGFVCEPCLLSNFECAWCGAFVNIKNIKASDDGDTICPVCKDNNSFRQLEVF